MTKDYKKELIRKIAREGMVLLKNENNALPLKKAEKVAAFGSTFYFCIKGGGGSGDMLGILPVHPAEAMKNTDVILDKAVVEFYEKTNAERYESELRYFNRICDWANNVAWTSNIEEPELSDELIESAAKLNDKAIINIARSSGENTDVTLKEGDFYLTQKELSMIERVCKNFKSVILLINSQGVIDTSFIEKYNFDAILYTSMGGSEMGNAVADILTGAESPSGKLASTWAPIEAYPTNEAFSELSIPYKEGLYVGYRYFDSFGIEPTYRFGFGLSYTDFSIDFTDCTLDGTKVTVKTMVKNVGDVAGKEVVQLYMSEPQGELNKVYQQLVGFQKTKVLNPSEETEVAIEFDLRNFAAYRESTAEYILEKGVYTLRLGNSSVNTKICARITLDNTAVTYKTVNRCAPEKPIELIKPDKTDNQSGEEYVNLAKLSISAGDIATEIAPQPEVPQELAKGEFCTLEQVRNGEKTIEEFVSQFSDEQLADILNGVTADTINAVNIGVTSRSVPGAAGETWFSKEYKIPPCVNADGPTGIRLNGHVSDVNKIPPAYELADSMSAFPVATCIANTWNIELPRLMAEVVSDDMSRAKLSGWLAPAMNIHRNPLCGRNFEYFSEDPLITGEMAAAVVLGTQNNPDGTPSGHYATVKHFAANNAEIHRLESDSVVSERALREIYLRGFEIAIKKAKPLALMNSYNKINGMYAADSYDLNTGILRAEWGFDGCVMTDWCTWNTAFLMPKAGCDLVMPGLKNKDYLEGIRDGRISRADAQKCAVNVLTLVLRTTK